MREKKRYLYLDSDERKLLIHSLNIQRNKLIGDGRYTDVVDELIVKAMDARIKKLKVQYV